MIIQIWMEGFRATGESSEASKIGEYEAKDFDAAVKQHMEKHPGDVNIEGPDCYMTKEAYKNRRSDYSIWACKLFDNETDARKAFG
ncbi:hypothetical protein LCGC14_0337630 [marine sediment metagenome]|uniref:Uncharacterized protein n=1 Tax=marine sediment metagenome TaxID=412755 RepID=A0A0F9W220_9ZZZZ